MRLDSGNRAFAAVATVSFAAYLAVGAAACLTLAVLGYRVSTGDAGSLAAEGAASWLALALLAAVAAGAILGLRSLIVQVRCSRALARRVRSLALPLCPEVEAAARRTGLRGRVRLVDAPEAFSFAYGALTPRVVVSRGLVEGATPAELEAVLAHERYHVHNLDPLKVLVARSSPAAFFFLPALHDLRSRYVAGRELAADRGALDACGRAPLAGALLKVVRGPGWRELGAAAAIGGRELLDARVAQLETGSEPRLERVAPTRLALSVLGVAALGLAAVAPLVLGPGGAEAVLSAAMPEMRDADALDVLGMGACAAGLAAALAGGYGVVAFRARRELDTTVT